MLHVQYGFFTYFWLKFMVNVDIPYKKQSSSTYINLLRIVFLEDIHIFFHEDILAKTYWPPFAGLSVTWSVTIWQNSWNSSHPCDLDVPGS